MNNKGNVLALKELIRFSIVGAMNTVMTTGLYLALVHYGVYYQFALIADYTTGITVGYLLNRSWTFGSEEKKHKSFYRYVATYLVVYAGNAVLLGIIVEEKWLNPSVGQLAALAVVSSVSFVIQKYWVFAAKNNKP